MTDNPQWVDLDRQLATLQQRHDQLLTDRTPLHPAVQDLAERITAIKEQLAATPRQVPDTKPRPAVAPIVPDAPAISQADQATLDELTAAVERTRQARDEAAAAEKKALAGQQAEPQFAVEQAQVVENRPLPSDDWQRLLATTFVVSAVMALGVGSLAVGANIEPLAASAAGVQADADAPVVATIPADNPLPNPAVASRRQSRIRRVLLTIGLLLIVACPLVAVWGVIGI